MTAYAEQLSYEDLYARWERGNWSATELDFARDLDDWRALTEFERRAALWNYSMFFHGEDAVATDLAPFITAAPREEQRYFLATQQVDEARHSVFFKRFMEEVVAVGGDGSVAGALEATRGDLTWGFRETFDMLDAVTDELRRKPTREYLARAVVMYHFLVEATLAQPGQHFIQDYLEARSIMPGFSEGMRNVSLDEQRHIGFGVRLLHDLHQESPAKVSDAVADLLREALPKTVGVFVPPGWDRNYVEVFGRQIEDVFEEGVKSFESKMRAAGMPLEDLPGPIPLPVDLPPRERAERALAMLEAGIVGEPNGAPLKRDAKTMEMLFDTIARAVDHRHAPPKPLTLQWDFTDAEPWHLRIDNGSTAAEPGVAPAPDVSLRVALQDWVDVMNNRTDPLRLMARGRLRAKGSPRAFWKMRALFPR